MTRGDETHLAQLPIRMKPNEMLIEAYWGTERFFCRSRAAPVNLLRAGEVAAPPACRAGELAAPGKKLPRWTEEDLATVVARSVRRLLGPAAQGTLRCSAARCPRCRDHADAASLPSWHLYTARVLPCFQPCTRMGEVQEGKRKQPTRSSARVFTSGWKASNGRTRAPSFFIYTSVSMCIYP
jgi:hypothetical protein